MVRIHFLCDQCVPTPDCAPKRTDFSQAKVENFGVAALCHKDVRGLNVAVNYAFGMCCIQSARNISRNAQKLFEFHWAARDHMLQCLAVQEFHGDERLRFMLSDFVNGADIWMIQCGSCSCFSPEAFESLQVVGKMFREELQRDEAAQIGIFGFVNHTHSSAAELFENAVVRNGLANQGLGFWHCGRY